MSDSQPNCILHIDTPGEVCDEAIKIFDSDKWSKVKDAVQKRLSRPQASSSKYWSLLTKLPDNLSNACGYHSTCYSRFTAISGEISNEDSTVDINQHALLRSQNPVKSVTTSGVFPKVCIFCNMSRKQKQRKELPLISCEYDSSELRVKEAAEVLNDHIMLTKIGSIGFHSKEVKYHNEFKRNYLNIACRASKPANIVNTANEKAFLYLCAYIQSSVIDNNRPECLTSLHLHYCQYLDRLSVEMEISITHSTAKTVGDKIVRHFGDKVSLEKMCKKQGLVLYNNSLCKEEACRMAVNCSSSEEFKIVESANILRSIILNVVKSSPSLPVSLSVNDFKQGQAKPPDILIKFLEILYCGFEDHSSERVKRQASSTAQDMLFCTSNGTVKPAKHLCMGVGLKSLTGN